MNARSTGGAVLIVLIGILLPTYNSVHFGMELLIAKRAEWVLPPSALRVCAWLSGLGSACLSALLVLPREGPLGEKRHRHGLSRPKRVVLAWILAPVITVSLATAWVQSRIVAIPLDPVQSERDAAIKQNCIGGPVYFDDRLGQEPQILFDAHRLQERFVAVWRSDGLQLTPQQKGSRKR
jgi:hypothetical protein